MGGKLSLSKWNGACGTARAERGKYEEKSSVGLTGGRSGVDVKGLVKGVA